LNPNSGLAAPESTQIQDQNNHSAAKYAGDGRLVGPIDKVGEF